MRPTSARLASARRQRGIVLFIALIAMVVLTLGAVALIRSVDTGTSAAANIAFRQASIAPVNEAIEEAINAILPCRNAQCPNDIVGSRYFASLQPGEKPNGVPAMLAGTYAQVQSSYTLGYYTDPATGLEVRSIVERVCSDIGAATIGKCDMLPPKVSSAGTDNEQKGLTLPKIPFYRVTVRVDLPNTNATSVAQAFLR